MTLRARHLALAIALAVAACTTSSPTTAPTASPTIPATASTAIATPLTPSTRDPATTPSPTGCPGLAAAGPWPSDRLVAVDAIGDAGLDRVVFRFAPASRPGATSTIAVKATTGPFTRAGSGAPVQIAGSQFTEIHVTGLLLVDDQGQPTFRGDLELRPNLPQVKHVVAIDASEGVMTWIIGSDFTCVALETQPAALTVAIDFSLAMP